MPDPARVTTFLSHLGPLQAALLAYARRALDPPGEAEDMVQSAVLGALRDFERFAEGTSFRAFVFSYLVHEVQNGNRRRRRLPRALDAADEPAVDDDPLALLEREVAYEGLLRDRERLLPLLDEQLVAALRSLSEAERETLLLRSLGELKYEEIAAATSVPMGTVMTRLHRARARLRRSLVDLAVERGLLPRPAQGETGARREM